MEDYMAVLLLVFKRRLASFLFVGGLPISYSKNIHYRTKLTNGNATTEVTHRILDKRS